MGSPAAVGSQNQTRYAYFPSNQRLAVTTGGDVWIYDTLNHQIGGFSQQQGSGGSITFSSQFGTVDLSTLPIISIGGVPQAPAKQTPAQQTQQNPDPNPPAPTPPAPVDNRQQSDQSFSNSQPMQNSQATDVGDSNDIIGKLERLGSLKEKGYITDEEFAAKKADLLDRL